MSLCFVCVFKMPVILWGVGCDSAVLGVVAWCILVCVGAVNVGGGGCIPCASAVGAVGCG